MKFSGGSTRSDKTALGKTMAGDDKKIKTSPAPKKEAPPSDKGASGVDTSKAEGGKIADASPFCSGKPMHFSVAAAQEKRPGRNPGLRHLG
jgi:hypothetical protein